MVLSGLCLLAPDVVRDVESMMFDAMVRRLPRQSVPDNPVIVAVDEKSLEKFGQWPWPRYRIAQLLDAIRAMGPQSVALDMVFAEADRTSLFSLSKELYRDLGVSLDLTGIPPLDVDNDNHLAKTLGRGPFVLGYKFLMDGQISPGVPPLQHPLNLTVITSEGENPEGYDMYHALGAVCNIPVLSRSVQGSGFLNASPDRDGILRRVPLVIQYKGAMYPSLGLAALMQGNPDTSIFLKKIHGGMLLALGSTVIPLDAQGNLLLHFRGQKKTFSVISAADVLEHVRVAGKLKDKVVLVGVTAFGLQDYHATALDSVFPGIEVHATVVDNILQKDFFSRPFWIRGVESILLVVWALLVTGLLLFLRPCWCVMILGLLAAMNWLFSQYVLGHWLIFFSPLPAFLILGVHFPVLTLMRNWREEQAVKKKNQELLEAQDMTIFSLSSLAETRDTDTGGHILRTQRYVRVLAEHLARQSGYENVLDETAIELLYKTAPLHDIGKVGVPDRILLKPGKLTKEEFDEMKNHTTYGWKTLQKAMQASGADEQSDFLCMAGDIAYAHHEKWDGTGYPRGLQGEEIPLSARLMAVADVYDALISRRVYKKAFSSEQAETIIMEGRGTQFDPDLVDGFWEIRDQFLRIARDYGEAPSS